MAHKLLEIKGLKVNFISYEGLSNVLDVNRIGINKGETFGLAGESGSGKSIIALSILKLVPCPPGNIECGEIIYSGENLLKKSEKEMRLIRGKRISLIPQDPMSSLNPVFTVGEQIIRVILFHDKIAKKQAEEKALELFKLVKLPDPIDTMHKYPHELSGGMRQRVIIAMALSCDAEFLIADEPTRALDVTIQAGILKLMSEIKDKTKLTVLFIASSLAVVSQMCDRVGLIYAGQIVEIGSVNDVFRNPLHPYTVALVKAIPKPSEKGNPLPVIGGFPPDPLAMPKGCRFYPRCKRATEVCIRIKPMLREIEKGHWVACHYIKGAEKNE